MVPVVKNESIDGGQKRPGNELGHGSGDSSESYRTGVLTTSKQADRDGAGIPANPIYSYRAAVSLSFVCTHAHNQTLGDIFPQNKHTFIVAPQYCIFLSRLLNCKITPALRTCKTKHNR